jgi:hypothetical protein
MWLQEIRVEKCFLAAKFTQRQQVHGIAPEGCNNFRGMHMIPARNVLGCPPKRRNECVGRPSGYPSMCLTAPLGGDKIVGLPQGYTAIVGKLPILALNARKIAAELQ